MPEYWIKEGFRKGILLKNISNSWFELLLLLKPDLIIHSLYTLNGTAKLKSILEYEGAQFRLQYFLFLLRSEWLKKIGKKVEQYGLFTEIR